jgi:hypothetical protein
MRLFRLLPLLLLLTVVPARAQQAPLLPEEIKELSVYYYKDPRVGRLVGFLERLDASPRSWDAYPYLAGLFAVVFRTNPDETNRLISGDINAKSATTITAALRLASRQPINPAVEAHFSRVGLDERLKTEFTGLPPRLEDIRIKTGTHLDILWGASFASGDPIFVRMIADHFARTANRSEQIALDVTRLVVARLGGPQDIYKELKDKYGDELGYEIVVASAALWGLQSNAKQHAFVEQAVTQFLKDNSGTHAAKALSAFRTKPKNI